MSYVRSQQIEDEFDTFFESIGYDRVTKIIGPSPDYKNADYIRSQSNTIIELKILEQDYFKHGGIIHRLQAQIAIPKAVNEDGEGFYDLVLPSENRHGKIDSFEEPLRLVLKKANRQLRETIDRLLNGRGYGFVMLALDMPTAINPFMIRNLVAGILSEGLRSISAAIICTPKIGPTISGSQRFCLHTHEGSSPKTVLEEVKRIASAWGDFFDNGGHSGII